MAFSNFPNFEYYFKPNSDALDIVLHGGSVGIDTPFMRKIIECLKKGSNSVLAFNFLYYERGQKQSSGKDLAEELGTLNNLMEFVHAQEYKYIRFIGKSLGGIVASYFLDKLPDNEHSKYSVIILGYVVGSLKLQKFSGSICVIQGEKDKFGGIEKVKMDLKNANSKDIKYFEIKGADHSYRDPETKSPVFEDEAIKILEALK